jgi:hypothetical protein
MITWQGRVMRVGAGPSLRRASWTWADGYNASAVPQRSTTSSAGAAAELVFALPVQSPVFPQLKVLARYYPSQRTEFAELPGPLEVGGLVATMSVGVATDF